MSINCFARTAIELRKQNETNIGPKFPVQEPEWRIGNALPRHGRLLGSTPSSGTMSHKSQRRDARLQNEKRKVRFLDGSLRVIVYDPYKDWRSAYEGDKRRGHRKKN